MEVKGHKIEPRANLRGVDLRDADLRGVDLQGANMSGSDMSGSDMRSVDMHGIDLRGSDMRGVDLRDADMRGVDLRDATGYVALPVGDPRGYYAHATKTDHGWRIRSACRDFTLTDALEHWSTPTDDRPDWLAAQYLNAIDGLARCAALEWFCNEDSDDDE